MLSSINSNIEKRQSLPTPTLHFTIIPVYLHDHYFPHVQSALYERSEHNFIRLEHARSLPQDTASENKYTRSASTLAHWLAQGILTIDEAPAVYLHDHYFPYQGQEYRGEALPRWSGWKSGTGG